MDHRSYTNRLVQWNHHPIWIKVIWETAKTGEEANCCLYQEMLYAASFWTDSRYQLPRPFDNIRQVPHQIILLWSDLCTQVKIWEDHGNELQTTCQRHRLPKSFDCVYRSSVWNVMKYYGIPTEIVNILQRFYNNSGCTVRRNWQLGEWFQVVTAVWKGCILVPLILLLVMDWVLKKDLWTTASVESTGWMMDSSQILISRMTKLWCRIHGTEWRR